MRRPVRRSVRAKHGFTGWALLIYAFLYLPILVMVIFAFDKPSATSLAAHPGVAPGDILMLAEQAQLPPGGRTAGGETAKDPCDHGGVFG